MTQHLLRGLLGFGLIAAAFALVPAAGAISLLLAPAGLVALRGCPTCWIVGLVQIISRGRVRKVCTDGVCRIERGDPEKSIAL